MAIGDRVKVGIGTINIHPDTVPIYSLNTDNFGNVLVDAHGSVSPKVIGGVKGGSVGEIVGEGARVIKSLLKGYDDGAASMGLEFVQMYPVKFEYYQQTAWVPQNHVHIFQGRLV